MDNMVFSGKLTTLMTEKNIFLNPDIVGTISQNFDFLSNYDRVRFVDMLNSIPGLDNLSYKDGIELLTAIFTDRAHYSMSLYNSKLLKGGGATVRLGHVDYEFSIVYPKQMEIDIDNTTILGSLDNLLAALNENIEEIQSIFPKDVLIWNLSGLAGKITGNFDHFAQPVDKYLIFCNDREYILIKTYYQGKLKSERWFKRYNLDSPYENTPALIVYYSDGQTVKSKEWYRNGKLHRENDDPAEILYGHDGRKIFEIWWENGEYMLRPDGEPTSIMYNRDGDIVHKEWLTSTYNSGGGHRVIKSIEYGNQSPRSGQSE